MKPSTTATSHSTHKLHPFLQQFLQYFLWLEPIYLALLALPLLLPGNIIPLSLHPYLLLLLFLFWPFRLLSLSANTLKKQGVSPQRHRLVFNGLIRWPFTVGDTPKSFAYLRQMPPPSAAYPLLFLLCLLPISLWVSTDQTDSYVSMGYLLLGITLYVALINWPPVQQQPRLLVQILAFIGIALALVAPLFTAWKVEFRLFRFPIYDQLRSVSLEAIFGISETIHANVLAGTLVLILPFLPILAIDKIVNCAKINPSSRLRRVPSWVGREWVSVGWILATFIVISTVVLSQSRGAYLAAVLSIGLMCALQWRKLFAVLIPIGAILVAFFIYTVDPFNALDVIATDSALGGAEFRLDVWSNSLYALSDFTFTGIGIGTFNRIVPEFYPFAYVNGAYAYHAHNLYLQIGLDLGLPGLTAYLILFGSHIRMLSVTMWSAPDLRTRLLATGAVGSLIALLTHGLLDAVTWGTKLAFIPWLIFALITILYRQSQDVESKSAG